MCLFGCALKHVLLKLFLFQLKNLFLPSWAKSLIKGSHSMYCALFSTFLFGGDELYQTINTFSEKKNYFFLIPKILDRNNFSWINLHNSQILSAIWYSDLVNHLFSLLDLDVKFITLNSYSINRRQMRWFFWRFTNKIIETLVLIDEKIFLLKSCFDKIYLLSLLRKVLEFVLKPLEENIKYNKYMVREKKIPK